MALIYRRSGRRSSTPYLITQRFGRSGKLTAEESEMLESLGSPTAGYGHGAEICADEEAATAPQIIVSGWACRSRLLEDGRRQIISLLLPSDMIGLSAAPSRLDEMAVTALTPVETVDARFLKRTIQQHPATYPNLERAIRSASRDQETYVLDHVVRLGRHTALERLALLLLELHGRLRDVGLASETTFKLPLTQECLSDVLGISIVHINRVMQQLRREGLIEQKSSTYTLLDTQALKSLSPSASLFERI